MKTNPTRKPMRVVSYSSLLKARAATAENTAKPNVVSSGIKKLESALDAHLQKNQISKKRSLEYQIISKAMKTFKRLRCDKLRTRDLIACICSDPSGPWSTYNKGQHITARQIAGLLKPFSVTSHDLYFADGNAKGYIKKEVRKAYRKMKELRLS